MIDSRLVALSAKPDPLSGTVWPFDDSEPLSVRSTEFLGEGRAGPQDYLGRSLLRTRAPGADDNERDHNHRRDAAAASVQ